MNISSPNASPLYRTVHNSPTDVWNDSCSPRELEYAIGNGAVGATTNPSIVLGVLKKEFAAWKGRLGQLVAENPTATEDAIAWQLIEEMGLRGAEMLLPVFERERRLKGRLSMQTNPVNYMDFSQLVEQAVHFDGLAPNIQVKIPATAAGIAAIEEVTRRASTSMRRSASPYRRPSLWRKPWNAASNGAPRKVTTFPTCGRSAR